VRPLIVALIVGLLGGCADPALRGGPNVVLITIDTLRADHCSLYGYGRPTTPFLEELARRATVFENAYAPSSWTAPSMASLFTSLPPRSHGVVAGFFRKGAVVEQDYLGEDFETLAEVLRRQGLQTFGVSTNAHLTARTGFAQGFDVLVERWWESAAVVNEEALGLRDALRAADRYFLWVHYFDPHDEYEAREPWFGTYARLAEEARAAAEPPDPAARARREALRLLQVSVEKYDSEINYVDAHLRALFAGLGLEANALVIVTSDHGEAFLEHGTLSHGQSLFEEEIRVPLLLKLPDQREPRRVASRVSLVDLYPTILEFVGTDAPPRIEGVSLLPAARAGHPPDRAIVTELDRDRRTEQTVTWRGWKLYRREAPEAATRLFDLESDPGERRDLATEHPERLRELEERWGAWKARWPPAAATRKVAPFSADEEERLRALGYL
jgi:arylsulfatase A-like enzyme